MASRKINYRRKLFSSGMTCSALGLTLVCLPGRARAEIAEDLMQLATDGDSSHLFPVNPAHLRPKGAQAGALLLNESRTSVLDHKDTGGSQISSNVADDFEAAAVLADLGAGAGVELSHTIDYHKVTTGTSGRRNGQDKIELAKIQHSQARLVVELTNELKAGIDIRFLHKDTTIYGDPFLGPDQTTHYVYSIAGYGAGFAYDGKTAGIGWTLYPPLRGSTEVAGEQKIVGVRGQVAADGWLKRDRFTVGLLVKEYFSDPDDLARGTTAADNQTAISLYDLDPDQYLIPRQLIMIGVDVVATKEATVRVSAGQESDDFNFNDYQQYNGVGVRQSGDLSTKTTRLRAALRFLNKDVQVDLGGGWFSRKQSFPQNMNGGSYKADGKEMFAAACLKI